MKVLIIILGVIIILATLAGCAPGPNQYADTPGEDGKVAGFWAGLWHGLITPITFIISLFNKSVQFYEVHNNGGWYNFGYLLGIMTVFGGSGGGAGRRSRS